MKFFTSYHKLSVVLALTSALFLSSCVLQAFTQPSTPNVDPNLTANKAIYQVDSLAGNSTAPILINSDIVIAGVVIADDVSGNFYKTMIIQDSTAGIAVQLDVSNFATIYPIGRKIFIKCKGLYVANDGNGNFGIGTLEAERLGRI